MNRRAWIAAIVVVVVALAGTIVLVRAVATAPLGRVAGRVCIGCVETHWNGASSIRANRITGRYAFREDAPYRVSFSSGTVVLAGETLDPGCHEGRAAEGDEIRFDDAREVRVEVPPGSDGCPEGGGS
jgi:hypothetical protein